MTARLLKLSNSPMFGYYGRVDSINKAVTIIGTQQLRDLALASSVIKIFRGIDPLKLRETLGKLGLRRAAR